MAEFAVVGASARFNGSEAYYPGKIFAAHPDQTYYVRFDDGDEQDRVFASYIRPEPWRPAACSPTSALATARSLRQVTPAEEPAAAQPEQEEDILGLDLGLNTMSVAEPPAAEKRRRLMRLQMNSTTTNSKLTCSEEATTRSPVRLARDPTVDSRDDPTTGRAPTTTAGHGRVLTITTRPTTREPESKPGTAGTVGGYRHAA